jgi:hypothetical protein
VTNEGLEDQRHALGVVGASMSARREMGDVVFVVGPARSGTTLLYKALCLHPDVAYVSNWVARSGIVPLAALNRLARRSRRARDRAWFDDGSNAYVYASRRPLRRRLFPAPVEGEPVYTRAGVARPGGPEPRRVDPRVALPAAFRSIASWGGGAVFVSKRIANNVRIPQLLEIFPGARFVCLSRDGRAVAASLARVDWWADSFVWWYGDTPRSWARDGGDPIEMCARNWVEEVRAIDEGLAQVPDDRILRVRFEDLATDPGDHVGAVASFLGLTDDERWRRRVSELVSGDRVDSWRDRLDGNEIETINAVQQVELEAAGYVV